MIGKDEMSISDLNFTQKSTQENEIQNLDIFSLNTNNDDNLYDLIIKIFIDKNDNKEFDFLSSDSNLYNQKSFNSSLLGKKHLDDSSLKSFPQINYVQKNVIKTKEKIFKINKCPKGEKGAMYRLDYYKKLFITNYLNYLTDKGKTLIKNCHFRFKNIKLHMPNYKLYGGNPKEKDNKEFLKKSIKQVFMDYDKTKDKGNSRQKDNEILINQIYKINNFPSSKEEIKLNEFFNMDIETGIKQYYESEKFQELKEDETAQYFDKMFYLEKNRKFSLLEDFGFIRLVNMPFYSKNPK